MNLFRNILFSLTLFPGFAAASTGNGQSAGTVAPRSCNADFTWVDSLGYVFFINNSTPGNSGNYLWDFGDGNFSTQYNPSHAYAQPGTYTVCLIAYDSLQNFCDSTCHSVVVTNVAAVQSFSDGFAAVNISPNPAGSTFALSYTLESTGAVSVSVIDLSGRVINNYNIGDEQPGNHVHTFNALDFPPGMYFIRIQNDNNFTWSKILITRQP